MPLGYADLEAGAACFKIGNIPVRGTGLLTLVVDDRRRHGTDALARTATTVSARPGVNMPRLRAFAVSSEQDFAWTAAFGKVEMAGCGAGDTLLSCGTWVGLYGLWWRESWRPIEAVVPVFHPWPSGDPFTPPVAQVRYPRAGFAVFDAPSSDGDNHTGFTGVALWVGPGPRKLGSYAGHCADLKRDSPCESAGFEWDPISVWMGLSVPGSYLVQLLEP